MNTNYSEFFLKKFYYQSLLGLPSGRDDFLLASPAHYSPFSYSKHGKTIIRYRIQFSFE